MYEIWNWAGKVGEYKTLDSTVEALHGQKEIPLVMIVEVDDKTGEDRGMHRGYEFIEWVKTRHPSTNFLVGLA